MADKVIGYEINIEGTDDQVKKLGELLATQKELSATNSELNKQAKLLSDANQKNTDAYKQVTDAIGKNKKAQIENGNAIKSTKRNVDLAVQSNKAAKGSYNALTAETNKLKKQLRELPNAFDKNNAAANKLKKQIKENTDQLKEFDKEVGDNFRNVGNYKEAFAEAAGASGIFSQQLGALKAIQATLAPIQKLLTVETNAHATAQTAANVATNRGVVALKRLKLALIKSGIGAAVVALGSLAAFFLKSRRGSDKLEQGMAFLSAGFDVFIDRIATSGEALTMFFRGDFSEAVALLKEQFKGFGEEMTNETTAAFELEKQLQELEERKVNFIVREAQLLEEIAETRVKATQAELDNIPKALELNQKAIDLTKELGETRVEHAEEYARILSAQVALGDSSLEEIREEQEAIVESNRIRTEENKKLLSLEAKSLSLRKQLRAKEAKENKDNEEGFRHEFLKTQEFKLEVLKDTNQKASDLADDAFMTQIGRVIDQADAEIEAEKKKQEEIAQAKEMAKQGAIQAAQATADAVFQVQQEALARETEAALTAAQRQYDTELTILNQRLEDGIIAEEEFIKQKEALDAKQARRERSIKKKQFEDQKALSIIQAVVNTALAITSAFATSGNIYAGIALAAVAAATGAAQIAVIASQKFAKGGVLPAKEGGMIQGNSHANGGVKFSVGGAIHEAEGGEVIINRKSSAMYRPLLSQINQAGGGVAFAHGGVIPKHQNGVSLPSVSGISPASQNITVNANDTLQQQQAMNQRVYVVESDITATQNRVSIMEETGTI